MADPAGHVPAGAGDGSGPAGAYGANGQLAVSAASERRTPTDAGVGARPP